MRKGELFRRSHPWQKSAAAVIGALVLVLAVVLVLAGDKALAAPNASGGGRTGNVVTATIGPEGGVLTLTRWVDPIAIVEVPPLAVTAPVTLVMERTLPPDHLPTMPWVGYSFVSFYLDAYRDGQMLAGFTFSQPVTISTFIEDFYTEMNWRLFYWDDGGGRWEEAVKTCTPVGEARREPSWLHTTVCRASAEFATLTAPFEIHLPLVAR